jgi:hypothetical protein
LARASQDRMGEEPDEVGINMAGPWGMLDSDGATVEEISS